MATVLLVEDDPQIRNAYSFVLAKQFTLLVAKDGEEALGILQEQVPDILLLDMLMPGLSGLELLRQTNLKKNHPGIKIVGFSNIDNPNIMAEARSLGVEVYVLKVDTTPHDLAVMVGELASTNPHPG